MIGLGASIMITIFTPTYNRADLLPKLYDSLKKQTDYHFEWLVVDDASADNTEEVMEDIMNDTNSFPISYYKQKHGGKHRAINFALERAKGEFFFIVDSDDYLKEDAVELIMKWTSAIKNAEKIIGVSGLRVLPDGVPTSGTPNFDGKEYIDASNFERYKYNIGGDQAEIFKTDILKINNFPEFEGEYFLEEAVVWNHLAELGYVVRWYPVPIYCCEYLETGLTKTRTIRRIVENFYGYAEYFRLLIHYGTKEEQRNSIFYFWYSSKKKGISLQKKCELIDLPKKDYIFSLLWVVPVYGIKKIVCKIKGK